MKFPLSCPQKSAERLKKMSQKELRKRKHKAEVRKKYFVTFLNYFRITSEYKWNSNKKPSCGDLEVTIFVENPDKMSHATTDIWK